MNIIVTGSHGFIGKKLVQRLIELEHTIISIDLENGYDITKWESIASIKDFDIVIHLAAISYVPKSYRIPREMFEVNIEGTLNMLELCRINNSRFVFTSSYVYGKPHYLPIDEKHPTESFNPYCQSKLIGEDLCKCYNKDFGVPVIIFRPFNIYGPGQSEEFLIPFILKQIDEGKQIKLLDSRPKRDFVHVDDVVSAYCKAINFDTSDFEIFNIGSGESYSVKEIAEILASRSGKKIRIEFSNESRNNEILDSVADINKAKKLIKWYPLKSILDME
jgi:UDP-glucose 4-epimerase